jgi:Xaa-Pro aminopeptidase
MNRTERLRTILEEPLLVSDGVNVRYLTGFDSSNAALLVAPDLVRLFSDFRYAEAARGVEGVEFVETKRSLFASLAELL